MSDWKYELRLIGNVAVLECSSAKTRESFQVSEREMVDLLNGVGSLSAFPLPASEYVRLVRQMCRFAGVPYKPVMVENIAPVRLRSLVTETPERGEIDLYLDEAKRMKGRNAELSAWADRWEKVLREMKKK